MIPSLSRFRTAIAHGERLAGDCAWGSWALAAGFLFMLACGNVSAEDFFVEKIGPLLQRRCYDCHSHASGKMKGGLTLDSRSGWQQGGDNGPTIVPGRPDDSLLVKMIRWPDEDHRMPPKEKLHAEEIALLEQWIGLGAPDPRAVKPEAKPPTDWWSLRPLTAPPVPGPGHPIDAFVQKSLSVKGLSPSPTADRRTLIRRLTYDLHGLPPTPDEVEAFSSDGNADAWDKLVDRLLASPRYGERLARHWFDVIHFADSHGFEHDVFRPNAWRYRDYVIESLNRDTPWARFIREQLAADALFPETPQLTAALGFLGAGTYDQSAAGTAPTQFEYLDRDDLVTQTMAAFVSTTANCARCHAHKFDPITQEDYFALQAVFAGIGKGDINYDADAAAAAQRRRWSQVRDAAARQDAAVLLQPENAAEVAAWEKARGGAPSWQPLLPDTWISAEGVTLERKEDGAILTSGSRPDKDTFTLTFSPPPGEITALRLDLLPDDALPMRGPGRQDNGNLHLTEFEVTTFKPGAAQPEKLAIRRATSDFDQAGFGVAGAIDGDGKSSWAIHPDVGRAHQAVFELAAPLRCEAGVRLAVALKQFQGGGHLLGKFRISATSAPGASVSALPAAVETAAAVPAATRTPEQKLAVAAAVLHMLADERLAGLPPQVQVWAAGKVAKNERGVITIAQAKTIRVLKRGELDKPGEEAAPGALSALAELKGRFDLKENADESARRAALAGWLADARNVLTWRSAVNRVWHYHFGKGLCDTPSDFGRMGGEPSHPELLDWLAVWFRDEAKGSLKALHRLILTSATCRQSSAHNPAAAAIDPANRLLWRMNRTRIDADSIRDSVLTVSGRIDFTMGGPGVALFNSRPGPQVTPILDYAGFDWKSPAASRRSIYRVVVRGIADPFMDAIDFPELGLLAPVRGFSASALQALALFNDEFILHHCDLLAQRAQKSAAANAPIADRIREVFRLALQRLPSPSETADFLPLAEKRGLAAVARVLLNSNEFLFID
jgi:hypothetical protein